MSIFADIMQALGVIWVLLCLTLVTAVVLGNRRTRRGPSTAHPAYGGAYAHVPFDEYCLSCVEDETPIDLELVDDPIQSADLALWELEFRRADS